MKILRRPVYFLLRYFLQLSLLLAVFATEEALGSDVELISSSSIDNEANLN